MAKIRFPLMGIGFLSLLIASWAGLLRMGWAWPTLNPTLALNHGPLMVCGFLGTVIGIERAVALSALSPRYQWSYIAPLLTGLGAISLILGLPSLVGPLLITGGSIGLVCIFILILRIQTALYTLTMAGGAILWLISNMLWLSGWPIYNLVFWWSGFLILTIAGERIELNRVLRLTRQVQTFFLSTIGLFVGGLIISLFNFDLGVRLAGIGMLILASWLLRYDIARYTVKKTDLTRFMALCLLTGYVWLGVSGVLGVWVGGITAGFLYDAILHTTFVGFVMSMIFGHAPIIIPAVTGKRIPYHPVFYSHLILLHLSLILRLIGDLTLFLPLRQWGGLLNAIAIVLFLVNTVMALRRGLATPVG